MTDCDCLLSRMFSMQKLRLEVSVFFLIFNNFQLV